MSIMFILLPPSEGKTPAQDGAPVDLSSLSLPELNETRREVLAELQKVSAAPDALVQLGVGERIAGEVARNIDLDTEPTAQALTVYTGVLFEALDVSAVLQAPRERVERVFIASALFGMVGALDCIPAYRLSMKTSLGDIGPLAKRWKEALREPLAEHFGDAPVLDCRSGDYRRPWPGIPENTVAVNVVKEVAGKRTTVSHWAKHTRGLVASHLLQRSEPMPSSPEAIADAVAEQFEVEYVPSRGKQSAVLTIVLPDA